MSATIAILGSALLLTATHFYWQKLFGAKPSRWQSPFLPWLIKGFLLPLALWTLLNSGLLPHFPSLVPDPRLARFGRPGWFLALIAMFLTGSFVIASFWAATTFAWMTTLICLNAGPDRKEILIVASAIALLVAPAAWALFHFAGPAAAGPAFLLLLIPVTHIYFPLVPTKIPIPAYSSAIAKIKFGKYKDAEWLVIRELEKCQDDFDGWMLLAQLYAERFGDLPEADRSIRDLCNQPNLSPVQISLALHRLADWHLKFGHDPAAARAALAEIESKCPGTHAARMAQLRRSQLPADRQELNERQQPKPIPLPPLTDLLDDPTPPNPIPLSKHDALTQSNRLVQKLNQNPNDITAREQFARLLAEHLHKPDLAIEQLQLLLNIPDPPSDKAPHWLALIASWQLKPLNDTDAARRTLQQLIHLYPHSPQAFAAQRRLNLLPEHPQPPF